MSDATGSNIAIRPSATENVANRVTRIQEHSTFTPTTYEEKVDFAVAVMAAESAKDNILNKTVTVKDIIIQETEMVNEQTGELEPTARTVLILDDNKAYYAFGAPTYRDAKMLLAIFGDSLVDPIKVKVTQGGTGTRKYLTLAPQK